MRVLSQQSHLTSNHPTYHECTTVNSLWIIYKNNRNENIHASSEQPGLSKSQVTPGTIQGESLATHVKRNLALLMLYIIDTVLLKYGNWF